MSIVRFMGAPDSGDGVAMVAKLASSWIYIQPPATAAISAVASASQCRRQRADRATLAPEISHDGQIAARLRS
jgi:hypothetical protein